MLNFLRKKFSKRKELERLCQEKLHKEKEEKKEKKIMEIKTKLKTGLICYRPNNNFCFLGEYEECKILKCIDNGYYVLVENTENGRINRVRIIDLIIKDEI